ncbi:MAG: GntR family transcriptional regulator [Desulfosporosinus sp.]|nr:GntR family transcriptional regulator [Desulfosporosinus sp.]
MKEDIQSRISSGILKPDEKLPSEPALAKEYNVSRPTLREALKMLQKEGVLISKNGVGTYVNRRSSVIENPLSKLQSLGKMIKNAGYKESETAITIYRKKADADWTAKLCTTEDMIVMERIRTADGQKVAFYYNIIPASIVGNSLNEDFSGAIFDFFINRLGIKITYAITEICAVDPANELDRLAIKHLGSEVLLLKQLHFDGKDRPIFYSLDYLMNSVFKLFIKRE